MLQNFSKNFIFLTVIRLLIVFGNVKDAAAKEIICKSATIRNVSDFNQLQNCTLMAGYVRIVEVDFSPQDLKEIKPSEIVEISEYLLVYHVNGLNTLEKLFPALKFIRGAELLYDRYALTIMENRDMENIGLVSLLRVLSGALRIEGNPLMCYVQTVDWIEILGYNANSPNIHIANNKSPNHCPLCGDNTGKVGSLYLPNSCWADEKFQLSLTNYRGEICIYSNCLTGCNEEFCKNCINYISDEGCTDYCQPYKYKTAFKRQCVTNCSEYGLVQHGLNCIEKCPKHYNNIISDGTTVCTLNCSGNFVVHDSTDLEDLVDCSTINGSLTIEILDMDKPIVEHLEAAFENLNEITGYLKIINSPQLTTLHFFKNLHTIRGLELIENRYALYVVDNSYLEELFLSHVAIFNGCIYFHLNPLLCLDKITDLEKYFKDCKKITVTDVSQYSNGERAVCGEELHLFNANVVDFNSTAALIEVDVLSSNALLLLYGYSYFYKEAPFQNVTKYDGRHGCGKDSWFTDTVITQRRRHIIKNLKPGTQYAYFVNSLAVMDHPYYAEHISPIQYFKTLPARPSAVAKLYANSRSDLQLDLHWWPPVFPNGVIGKYILSFEILDTPDPAEVQAPNTPFTEDCKCPTHHSESIVPTPHVEEFYSKEKYVYKNAVSNFIFHKKKPTNTTKTKANATDLNYESVLMARYIMALQKMEEDAANKQEEGKESYVIEHPKPVCGNTDPNERHQKENSCEPLETFKKMLELPGNQHSFSFSDLKPQKTYRFGVRACVNDLINGCGPAKYIEATTMSKQLASLLAKINQ